VNTDEMVKFDAEAFLAKFNQGLKSAMRGIEVFQKQTLETYAKFDTELLELLMGKSKAPKPPRTHAAHRTMSHRKAAGSKRRMGLWNV
jgi:hypothetical protein